MAKDKKNEKNSPPNYRGNLYRKIIYLNGSKIAVTAKSEKEPHELDPEKVTFV